MGADVVVAGAGVAGTTLAYELSRRGVSVVLLERGENGPVGASTVPAALINPHRGRSGRAKPADTAGAAAFWELVRSVEAAVGRSGAHPTGVLRVADNARQARLWQKLEGTDWLEPGDVPPEYHAPFGAMLVPKSGWLRSGEWLSALAAAARLGSAEILNGVELVGVERAKGERNGAVTGAVTGAVVRTTSAGDAAGPSLTEGSLGTDGYRAARSSLSSNRTSVIACRAVVVATGAWQPAELPLPRFELVWGEARALDLGSTPPLPLAGSVVAAFEGGKAFVTGGHRHAGWLGEPAAVAEGDVDLQRAVKWQVPAAAEARVLESWTGVRAKRPSGEPVARRLQPGVHMLAAFGGRGFLRVAPLAARLADELAARLS